jgi:hypothetical protein
MDAALVSALSVAGGSLVGAMTTLASTWLTQRHSDRRERLAKALADRETLYATFISEASRVLIESFDHSLDRIDSLLPLYTLVGRIRLSSSQAVVTSAETLMREIVERYSRPNLTPPDPKPASTRTGRSDGSVQLRVSGRTLGPCLRS